MNVHVPQRKDAEAVGARAAGPRRRGRVLVVDDEPNVRQMFRLALESVGYAVDEAADGNATLEWLGRSTCDVVLLDLMMPVLDGMETLRRLRDRACEVPVVIVTAHGSIPDAVEAMRLGAVDFLSKPLTPDMLRGVVAEVIERHAATRPEPPPQPTGTAAPTAIVVGPSALDLSGVKLALNRRRFDEAATLLEQSLDADPHSAEAHMLMGVLFECRGKDHAAYQSYKEALTINPQFGPARDNLRRYCVRFGLDPDNPVINPAAGH